MSVKVSSIWRYARPFVLSVVKRGIASQCIFKKPGGLKIPFVLSLSMDEWARWPRMETPFD